VLSPNEWSSKGGRQRNRWELLGLPAPFFTRRIRRLRERETLFRYQLRQVKLSLRLFAKARTTKRQGWESPRDRIVEGFFKERLCL
jgi:hypothetical protein